MGVIADDLGLDCADCHPNAGTDQVDWVIDTTRKRTARRMVEMVATINRTNFAGVQKVTCWTCHHGRDVPASTIALDNLYDTPNSEKDDIVKAETDGPTATQILDKYIAAVGGAQRLAGLTSVVINGREHRLHGLGRQRRLHASTPRRRIRKPRSSRSRTTRTAEKAPGPFNGTDRLDEDAARPVQRGRAGRRRAGRGQTGSPVGLPRADQAGPHQLARRPEAAASAIATTRSSRAPARGTCSPRCTSIRRRACSRG